MNTADMNTTTHGAPATTAAPTFGHALRRRVLDGLRAGEFCIAYQGIYRVDSGDLSQIEALIRWRHPDTACCCRLLRVVQGSRSHPRIPKSSSRSPGS